jgi:predicted DNA-binding transcriptional regulator AlpA
MIQLDGVTEVRNMASVRDVMQLLDVSRTTVLKWLADDRFPNAKKGEGVTSEWDIPREDIEAIRQDRINDLRRQISDLETLAKLKR